MPNRCAKIKLQAERRAGVLLADREKNKGAATPVHGGRAIPRLKDIGVTEKQSHRWQAVATHDLELCSIVLRTFGNFLIVRSRTEFDS